jgi:uncharacterized repeat protein (TIGR03803 family)
MHRRLTFPRIGFFVLMNVVLAVALDPTACAAGKEVVLHGFTGGSDGSVPLGSLVVDSQGNLYGTTAYGGLSNPYCGKYCGTVYKLSPSGSTWTKTILHDFTGGDDGYYPNAGLALDGRGNLYGTTYFGGGQNSNGTVFELTHESGAWREQIIHRFNASTDGAGPEASLVFDNEGNLFGTTQSGGTVGGDGGTVFELSPGANGWTETILHSFGGPGDGAFVQTGVALDSSGNVYGTASWGGTATNCEFSWGCGIVFELSPNSDGSWTENVLHNFDGGAYTTDGAAPETTPIFDSSGNLYGTTSYGGDCRCAENGNGTVYELTPNGDGTWTENSIYYFAGGPSDGNNPNGNIVFDKAGNLYGTTSWGGDGGYSVCADRYCGTAYELSPAGGGWTERIILNFGYSNGAYPNGVIINSAGRLYGQTSDGGASASGLVFEVVP